MSEQQIDFKKIVAALKSEKYTPQQLGGLFKQYYKKHLSEQAIPTQTLDNAVNTFNSGELFS